MGSISTDSNISGILGAFHDKRLLEVFEKNTVFYQLGEKRPLEMNNGKTVTFHQFSTQGRGGLLTEATQPANSFMTNATLTATIVQFGDVTAISDILYKTAITNMLAEAAVRYGEAAGRTIDEYIQDRLYSDETTFSSSGHEGPFGTMIKETHAMSSWYKGIHGGLSAVFISSSTSANTILSALSNGFLTSTATYNSIGVDYLSYRMQVRKLRYLVAQMESNSVPPAAGEEYIAVMHPVVISHLREDGEWREWNRYNNAEKMFKGEVGMVENCRIIKSSNCLNTNYQVATGNRIYLSTLLGKQAFAITELSGEAGIKMYTVPFDNKDSSNVLQQNAYLGWKFTGAAKVLQPKAGYGILTA